MTNEPLDRPFGSGEMAHRIRTHDWGATSLGPCKGWSQRLQVMVEQVLASPLIATLVCGPERLLIYNDAAARLFGDQHPAALGRPLPSVFPVGWETVAPFYERAFAGEVVTIAGQPLDTRGEGAPTEVFDALLTPVREAEGPVAYVHMMGFDIAGRQRCEAALRDSKARLRLMLDNLTQATWEADAAGLVTTDIPSWRAYTGQSLAQCLGHGWLDAIHIEDRAYAERQWREAIIAGHDVNAEFRLRSPDGGWRWTNVRAVPLLDDQGLVRKWLGVNIDVDTEKRSVAALRESEERQRLLLEGMPQLVWRAVGEGRWTWASRQWIEHTGLSDAASQGHGWLNALHPEDREVARTAWARAQVDGFFQAEYRILNARCGLYHWFQTRGTPIRRADGSVVEWLGTSTDIDEQVRAREFLVRAGEELEQRVAERTTELQHALDTLQHEAQERGQAEERLRQSEKLKAVGQLTGGIAHDFNNMLQGITSALALVQARLEQGRVEAAQGYIEPAQKAAARAGALTHRLLAFSRQQTLSPRLVNLERIARDMEDMIRRAVGPVVQVELKSSDGHWLVLCDSNQMESALLNLCINARDAMPEGGWLTIGVEERMFEAAELAGFDDLHPGRFVMLSVTDTGSGMPPEVVARAFEPFFTTKPPGQGTGLGLSQIYGFMRQSGGLVQIETAPGAGTTVRLGLPVHAPDPQELHGTTKNGKTLLLVEDEHDLRRMLADQLRDLGYGVLEADTAEAALRILHTGQQIDLLVTDVGLRGGMNGRQLVDAVYMQTRQLPVIFMTGYAGDILIGEESILRKPFKPALLALLVNEKMG